jgi:two-component system chemotaxis sensor kinase CheA
LAGPDDKDDSVRDEFLAEAQEIVEALSRDLLVLDHGQKEGSTDPDLVNEVFRGVHTLKGIAGMFGYHHVGAVAHALEDLLDDLRLGRVQLSQEVLDVLFEGVENFQRLLGGVQGDNSDVDLSRYAQSIERVSASRQTGGKPLEAYAIDPGVLAVLTEYEEHRLRTNVEQGVPLYRLMVRFSLTSIDTALEDMKARAKPLAEIITYLPSMGEADGDSIDLDVLLASRAPLARLREVLGADEGSLKPVPRHGEEVSEDTSRQSMPKRADRPPTAPPPPAVAAQLAKSAAQERVKQAPDTDDEAESDEAGDLLSLRSVSNTVRVDIRKLDHLMNVVGELALVRSALSRITERIRGTSGMRPLAIELHRAHRSFERHLEELQDGILDVRMVPLRQIFDKLARVVRQVAREHEKEIRLVVTGADTEVDKLIVEELSDPLMHIIRNAIDHGIEKPKMRELAGKPTVGTLALNAYQKGNHVLIEVEDDGSGMNPEKLFETAVRRGLIHEDARGELSREEILSFVFLPGFTTRSSITDLSGRGVGMDVVKTNITRLGGIVDVESELGTGTKFTITLPITLAIISALVVRVGPKVFAIPLTAVQEALVLRPEAVRTVEGREVLTLRGATLPLCRLDRLFGIAPEGPASKRFVVVTALGAKRLGFVVDELQGQQDIVIKPLGKSLSGVRGFAGATDLGDQHVALVLDAATLLEEVLSGSEQAYATGGVS